MDGNSITPSHTCILADIFFFVGFSFFRFVHKSKELSDFLNHPNVEGLYELQLPLQMRAVLETGCIVTVSDKRRRVKNDRVNFTLDDLTMKSVSNKFRYLSSGSSDYNRIYVYHSYSKISNLRGCGLWALFFLDEGTAFVWVTNPFGVTERISLTEIYNHYKTLYKTEGVDSDVSFTLHRSKSKDQTRKEVALMISDYQASKPGKQPSNMFSIYLFCAWVSPSSTFML